MFNFCISFATLLFLSPLVSAAGFESCYLPAGEQATNPQWETCSDDPNDPLSRICCATNRTLASGSQGSGAAVADKCLSNGLCLNYYQDDAGTFHSDYTRAYCTDPDFNSGNCLDICGKDGTGFKAITPCDGTQNSSLWCCGSNTDCCNEGLQEKQGVKPVTLMANFQTTSATAAAASATESNASSTGSSVSNTASASTSASASATKSGSPSTTPGASQGNKDEELSTGAKAGIGIGVSVGALGLLGVGAFMWMRRRHRKEPKMAELPYETGATKYGYQIPGDGTYLEANGYRERSEMDESSAKYTPGELSGQAPAAELPADVYNRK